ncbi:AMP-binding protein [Streptomyces microflavus]|uniref:AMP-binding protein n=1 Tax=Streptomyces microflavus TaxID=1919 RepID=UPI00341CDF9E
MTTLPSPLLWPDYSSPSSLAEIEQVALSDRNLPASTYAVLERAAELWPDRPAMTFLPRADAWDAGATRTYAELRAEVDRIAALFRSHTVSRGVTVALLSPNTALLPPRSWQPRPPASRPRSTPTSRPSTSPGCWRRPGPGSSSRPDPNSIRRCGAPPARWRPNST